MIERFTLGLVGAPFGLEGFVKINSLSGEHEHLTRLTIVTIQQDRQERVFEVEATAPLVRGLAIKFKGIDSPEAAKRLGGARLVSDRSHAVPLQQGEWYIEDLRGLTVRLSDGETVGWITDIVEGGGGNLAEIQLQSGELKFIPFRKEFLSDIDIEKGSAVLVAAWVLE
ncbi:MAG: ribosome maturation factor RimM [Treponema sp.]|jgi:16S rRNA processing protein RimM|nr:ribosome maturation factor RimM [Treponema sp.]